MKKELKIWKSTIAWLLSAVVLLLAIITTCYSINIRNTAKPYLDSISVATSSMDPQSIETELENAKKFIDANTTLEKWSVDINNAINSAKYLVQLSETGSDNLMVETAKMQEMVKEQDFVKYEITLFSALDFKLSWLGDLDVMLVVWTSTIMIITAIVAIGYSSDEVMIRIPIKEKNNAAC